MDGNRGFAPTQDASPPRGGRERPKAHEAGESPDGCDCFREVNEHLKTLGGELLCSLLSNPQRVFIATHKKKGARKLPLVQASFCPFCGEKYPPARSIFKDSEAA